MAPWKGWLYRVERMRRHGPLRLTDNLHVHRFDQVVRYTDTSKANLGFQNLMFKNIPLYYDPDCPNGTALFLNSKYIGMTLHSDRNFKQSPFSSNLGGMDTATANGRTGGVAPTAPAAPAGFALDARVSFITTYGNTTVRNRRRLAKLINATFV